MSRTCTISDCGKPVHGRGWCLKHYRRWTRHGDPTRERQAAEDRFWSKADRSSDCWLWTAGRFPQGYGQFKLDGRPQAAHRVAYELVVGPIPEGLELDHTCHNGDESCQGGDGCRHRRCVNPAHLEPVLHVENIRRGRTGEVRGAQQRAKTHCPQGHPYDDANTYSYGSRGGRQCRTCKGMVAA